MGRNGGEGLSGRLDRLSVERLACAAGLPQVLAARVAEVIVESRLPDDRREEVFRELVAHFEDGLTAGRTPEELLATFGDGKQTADLIGRAKQTVTPEPLGGSGPSDSWAQQAVRDLRYAVRRLAARPAFTMIAVLSLALGIGANAAVFTLVNDVIFRKPPIERPEEVVEIYRTDAENDFLPISYPDLEDLNRLDAFEGVGGFRMAYASVVGQEQPERITLQLVSGNFFSILGIRAERGRMIQAADAPAPGVGSVAVLSDRYWRRVFGADPSVIGRTLSLTAGDYTVIGVATPAFEGSLRGISTDVYIPLTRTVDLTPGSRNEATDRANNSIFVRARLRSGGSIPEAEVATRALATSLREQRLESWEGKSGFTIIPAADVIFYPPVDNMLRPLITVLMIVVGLVLVIACANLAGFLLARAIDRRKEIGVRLSLGATRGQLVRQLLIETMLLGVLGGVLGVIVGRLSLRAVLAADLPLPAPVTLDLPLDWRVLAFTTVVSIVAGLLAGLAPALQATRVDLAGVIREESAGGGRQKSGLRNMLVTAQVAVSVVLLLVAGLFVRSLSALRNVDVGFGKDPTALVWVMFGGSSTPEQIRQSLARMHEAVRELPGVTAVGLGQNVHLNVLNRNMATITVDGVEPPPGEVGFALDRMGIDTGYVRAAGLRITAGRNLTATDLLPDAPPVALVNEAFAARYWPGVDPIGRHYRVQGREIQVVGIVANAKIRDLAEAPRPFAYDALGAMNEFSEGWFVVSAPGDARALLRAAVRAIRQVDPNVLIMEQRTMREHLDVTALPVQLGAGALAGFALLALIMASLGLYGSVSYSVSQRVREVGIRLSLGADRGAVIRMLMWGGVRLALIGIGIGLVVGLGFGRLVESTLYGVRALDPVTLLLVPVVLLGVTGLAAFVPARRAGSVDPVKALRQV